MNSVVVFRTVSFSTQIPSDVEPWKTGYWRIFFPVKETRHYDRSECLVSFTGKKIRQYPVFHGSTSLGICVENETVRKTTTEFMKKLGYKGILDVGYRYDARDGQYKLLDVNPRIGSTFRLFVAENGMDVARAM